MNLQNFPYIDRILQNAIETGSTPGVALLVDKNEECVYRKAFGYAQVYPEQKTLHEQTIFDVASLTKVIAATTAVMLLLRDKRLALQDPVQKYLSKFPHTQVTFTHLLTHTAGFPAHIPFYEMMQRETEQRGSQFIGSPEAKQFVIQKICDTELLYNPGQYSKYSDLGFILLGHIIEVISGCALDQYCDENIFHPLGMLHTFFRRMGEPLRDGDYAATERCEWRHRILYGEAHDENAYAVGGVCGHAGLFSTLDDIRRFMRMLHQCYQGQDDTIPKAIIRQFFSRQNIVEGSSRALGWDTPSKPKSTGGTLLSNTSVGHTGFTGTSIWWDLKRALIIILLSNRVHPSRHHQTFLNMRPKIHDAVVIATDE